MQVIDNCDLYFYKKDLLQWMIHITETEYEDYIAPNENFKCSLLRVEDKIYMQVFNESDATVIWRTSDEFLTMKPEDIVKLLMEHIHNYTNHF